MPRLCTAVPVLMVMMAIGAHRSRRGPRNRMIGPLSTILMGWSYSVSVHAVIAAGTVLVIAGIFVFTRKGR